MMKRQSVVVPLLRLIIVCSAISMTVPDRPVTAAPSVFQFPSGSVNQKFRVVGRLELEGQNYFLDPRFVIVDDQDNRVLVTTWAPLEIPPAPPGAPHPASNARTMKDYLHQRFSVIGIHRVVVESAGQSGFLGAPGDSYLEVLTVTDYLTGKTAFTATTIDQLSHSSPQTVTKRSTTEIGAKPVMTPAAPVTAEPAGAHPSGQTAAQKYATPKTGASPVMTPAAQVASGPAGSPASPHRVAPKTWMTNSGAPVMTPAEPATSTPAGSPPSVHRVASNQAPTKSGANPVRTPAAQMTSEPPAPPPVARTVAPKPQ